MSCLMVEADSWGLLQFIKQNITTFCLVKEMKLTWNRMFVKIKKQDLFQSLWKTICLWKRLLYFTFNLTNRFDLWIDFHQCPGILKSKTDIWLWPSGRLFLDLAKLKTIGRNTDRSCTKKSDKIKLYALQSSVIKT